MSTDTQEIRTPMTMKNSSTTSSSPQHFGTILSTLLAPFARRFIAGTTLAEALDVTASLKAKGFLTTLDHLGESVASTREATAAADQYIIMLRALKERGLDRNVSLKLTQMGLSIDPTLCFENVKKIVAATEASQSFVRIDMEGSDVAQATLDMVVHLKQTRNTPIGIVLQAMLKRTPMDMVSLLERGISIRLCKGAYREPANVAWQQMVEIRHQYAALAKRLITSSGYHGIATHDPALISEIKAFAKTHKIAPDQFEFQMLLGIRPSLQKQIVAEGWRLRLYVPFGKAWLPYTWRRIRERKENLWFAVKSMFQR